MGDYAAQSSRRFVLKMGVLAAGSVFLPHAGMAQTNATAAKIGIIGSGKIGSTLGTLWIKGRPPGSVLSSRHPEELKDFVAGLGFGGARAGTPEEAIAFGDAILIAVPYKAYPQLGRDYARALSGKVVLDTGNATVARDGQELVDETKQNGIGLTRPSISRRPNRAGFQHARLGILARDAHKQGGLIGFPSPVTTNRPWRWPQASCAMPVRPGCGRWSRARKRVRDGRARLWPGRHCGGAQKEVRFDGVTARLAVCRR